MTLRKTFEGDFEKMELTWPRVKQKIEIHGEKEMAPLSLMDRSKIRRRRCSVAFKLRLGRNLAPEIRIKTSLSSMAFKLVLGRINV